MVFRSVFAVALVLLQGSSLTAQVQSPTEVFGFRPGTDYRLADYNQVSTYFEGLARGSGRVVLDTIGVSSLGRPMLLAIISSEDNIRNRARYREISERLATVGTLTDDEARRLANEGKAVVWIDGGLHATEVAHGQMTPELAHWLALDEGEEARRIRETSIVLIMPNMNPDGLDIVVNWYRGNVGTEFETASVPELYHHYIGHDNNRDWYMFTQLETQAVANQLYHVWFPQIVYNHHQSSPFPGRIWVPPFENPVNPNLDPAVVTGISQIGEAMKRRFALEGKPGANSGIVFDMWWNGSMRGAPDFHNMLGFLTETALYRYATPYCYSDEEIPEFFNERAGNLPARRPTTQYPDPWLGGCWHLRDPIEYMLTASRAVLDMASRHREDYLYNIYHVGKRQIAKGNAAVGGPFAYVIDMNAQHDPTATVAFLRTFRKGGIEIRRATRAFSAGGTTYPAGTYVIPPQAFRPYVVDLMEPKTFPDRRQYPGGPPEPPYDMTGYELRFQMGVNAVGVTEPFALEPTVFETVTEVPSADIGTVTPVDGRIMVSRTANAAATLVNRALSMGARVDEYGNDAWGVSGNLDRVTELARGLGVPTVAQMNTERGARVRQPRIGLYEAYVSNMPGGWTRWMLEQYDFAFETIKDGDVRSGDLDRFDIIILPSQAASSIVHGHRPGTMPAEFTGGITDAGADRLVEFVRNGGWLMTVNRSIDFAIEQFQLPVRNVTVGLPSSDFFIPGSLINVDLTEDVITRGMPDRAVVMFARSQVMDVEPSAGATVFARYPATGYLRSGWAHGAENHLAGRVAGVRMPVDDGMVVMFGFDPNFRGQPHNTFKLLFNTLFASAVR